MRPAAILVTGGVLLLAAPASAQELSTFTLSGTGSVKNGVAIHVAGKVTLTVLNGATVTATLPGGKSISAKSYSWSWHQNGDMHTTTQTMTLKVQIQSATGVTDCVAGTNGTVTLVDSTAKLANGRTKDAISGSGWSAPCQELTVAITNAAAKTTANVSIKKS